MCVAISVVSVHTNMSPRAHGVHVFKEWSKLIIIIIITNCYIIEVFISGLKE